MNSIPPAAESPVRDVQDFVLGPMRGSDLLARLEPIALDPEDAARRVYQLDAQPAAPGAACLDRGRDDPRHDLTGPVLGD